MTAVLILTDTMAIPIPAYFFGVMLAAIFSAIAQWLFSARSKRQFAMRLARAVIGASAVYIVASWDCGWWAWLCTAI